MFRLAIIPLFASIFPLSLAFGILFTVLDDGWRFAWRSLPFEVSLAAVISFAIAVPLRFLYPTQISADGVHAYSFWGARRFIAWDQVAAVRPLRFLTLR
jgi:hypothetical protein